MKKPPSSKLTQALSEIPDIEFIVELLYSLKEPLDKVEQLCDEVLQENRSLTIQLLDLSIKYKEMETELRKKE